MREWSPWDWIAWASIGLTVVSLAVNSAILSLPEVRRRLPSWLKRSQWGFLPSAAFCLATIIFVLQAVGVIESSKSSAPTIMSDSYTILDLKPIPAHFSLKLRFRGGDYPPVETSKEHVLSWYALWRPERDIVGKDINGQEHTAVVVPKTWDIFLNFDRPIQYNQVLIQPSTRGFPPYEIKWTTTTSVLIVTTSDIPSDEFQIESSD